MIEPFISTGSVGQPDAVYPLYDLALTSPVGPASSSDSHQALLSKSSMGAQTESANPASYSPQPILRREGSIAAANERSMIPAMGADSRLAPYSTTQTPLDTSLPAVIERHMDAGPMSTLLLRSESGRLPPAYGEQRI